MKIKHKMVPSLHDDALLKDVAGDSVFSIALIYEHYEVLRNNYNSLLYDLQQQGIIEIAQRGVDYDVVADGNVDNQLKLFKEG